MHIEVRPLGNGLISITPEEGFAHAMTTEQIASQICGCLQGHLSHSGDNFYIKIRG